MSSDRARACQRLIAWLGAHRFDPLTPAGIARELDVDPSRVERWARAEYAPSAANERRLAALVLKRSTANEAYVLGLHLSRRRGCAERVWRHTPSRRRRLAVR